jgi:hypothetical protein
MRQHKQRAIHQAGQHGDNREKTKKARHGALPVCAFPVCASRWTMPGPCVRPPVLGRQYDHVRGAMARVGGDAGAHEALARQLIPAI